MRIGILFAATFCYLAFFAAFVYLIGFVAAFDPLPTHVDKGNSAPIAIAATIDIALIVLFGLQHSAMARPAFKARWTRIVPPPLERSIYCLASALCLIALFVFWHPIEGTVWSVEAPAARTALWALFFLGWGVLFVATHLINHWELFGMAQAWRHYRGADSPVQQFRTPLFYRLLAVGFTAYIFIGIAYEERDLVGHFGETYITYRRRVGAVFPGVGRHR